MKSFIPSIILLLSLPMASFANYQFSIEYAPCSAPVDVTFPLSQLIEFTENENEFHGGGFSSAGTSCPPSSISTHEISYHISIYKTESPDRVKIKYQVNDETGELTTSSLPIEIKLKEFYFESHPNTPYTLAITFDKSKGVSNTLSMPDLEPAYLEELKVDPVGGDQ